jgi:hypothetical protein
MIPRRFKGIECAIVFLSLALAAAQRSEAQLPAVEVSGSGRFLQTADGQPFLWIADTAWSLWRLDPKEVDEYMANRAAKGFTVIQGPQLVTSDENYAGESNPDFLSPNEAWFEHIDHIVTSAAEHGLYVAPVLAWGNDAEFLSTEVASDWGLYIGDRYKNTTNIAAFVVAGEFNFPSANVPLWTALAEGVQSGLAGNEILLTALPQWFGGLTGQSSSGALHNEPWLALNMHQSSSFGNCTNDPSNSRYIGTHNWLLSENDWSLAPAKPMLDAEPTYEQQPTDMVSCDFNDPRWDAFGCRRRAYWSIFAGACGHTYGANGVYQAHQADQPIDQGAPLDFWQDAMDYPGAFQMGYLRDLLESRPLTSRIPGQDFLIEPIDDLVPTHVHATRDESGRFAMVYIPGADRDVTVDLDLMAGDLSRAWWFSPETADATLIGEYSSSGTQQFTTPDAGEDWVLVVDDADENYGPPGEGTVAPPPGDLDGDGAVGPNDLATLLSLWGPCAGCDADLDGDGDVGPSDLAELLSYWS